MTLKNRKKAEQPKDPKFERKDPSTKSKVSEMLTNHGIPGETIIWKPSDKEEYEIYIQVLSDTERQGCIKAAIKSLKENEIYPGDMTDTAWNQAFNEEVACHILQVALREPEETELGNRKILFRSVEQIRKELTTDRITQLFRFYNAVLERDSPSMHYLESIKDFDEFCEEVAKGADGDYFLELSSLPSQALVEIITLMAQHSMTNSQQEDWRNTLEFPSTKSNTDIGSSTSQPSDSSKKKKKNRKQKKKKPKEVKPITEDEAKDLANKIK